MNEPIQRAVPERKGKLWIVWGIALALAVIAGIIIFSGGLSVEAPAIGTGDTTSAIGDQLESIDLGSLEAEFEAIDTDLNQL